MFFDEIPNFWTNHFTPATTGEYTVMTAFWRYKILAHGFRNAAAQFLRRFRLTGTRTVVQFAFNSEYGDRRDVLWANQFSCNLPCT